MGQFFGRTRSAFFSIILIGAAGAAVVSCSKDEPKATPVNPITVDFSAIDNSVDPCDDFYQFACGTWIKNTELPAGYSRYTKSFDVMDADNSTTLKSVLEKFAAKDFSLKVTSSDKLGDYYASCNDLTTVETSSQALLPTLIAEVNGVTSKEDLLAKLATWHLRGVNAFFGFYAGQDAKDATRVIAQIDRGGMGLPDRDFYFNPAPEKVKLRGEYLAHVGRMLMLSGMDQENAGTSATAIMALETELAKHSLKKEERRDPNNVYHLIGVDGLKGLASTLAWDSYFKELNLSPGKDMNVVETDFFKGLDQLVASTDLDTLKSYLRWQVLHSLASSMGRAYVNENFEFYGKALSGKKDQLPRWKTCINSTSGAMGEALGDAFVQLTFGANGKAEAKKLIDNLSAAVKANFNEVPWMDADTRTRAIDKLDKIVSKMGYPDTYRDYSSLVVNRTNYLANVMAATAFETNRVLGTIGKPVDKAQWDMVPHEVNAYYNPGLNEIVFPAGILQSPFFNAAAPSANNYGGIGMVIGHEISHAFDDEGRQFDADGNLRDWWTPVSAKAFEERAECLVKQYDGYTVANGTVHLNGRLTLGENIADLGGLKLAEAAFQKAKGGGRPIGGFSEDQQFYVAFAQGWCTKMTVKEEAARAATDPHANPRYRVNGVVVNLPNFEKTFACKSGKPMAPKDRCSIW